MKAKTIAIIDTLWIGHHPTFFKNYTRALLELGYRVLAFCPDPEDLHQWATSHIGDRLDKESNNLWIYKLVRPREKNFGLRLSYKLIRELEKNLIKLGIDSYFKNILSLETMQYWRDASVALDRAVLELGEKPDLVFLAMLDNYLSKWISPSQISQIFPYQWSGLYLHPRHLRLANCQQSFPAGSWQPDNLLNSSLCQSVALLDEGVVEKLSQRIARKPIVVFPDITNEAEPDWEDYRVKELKEKAKGRKIIGLFGSLDKRKGILTLLSAAEQLKEKEYFFILAGKLWISNFSRQEQKFLKDTIESSPSNCLFYLDDFIPDGVKINGLLSACDILMLAYEKVLHSSNMLTKAAVLQKHVIVSEGYCMAERTKKYRLGLTIAEGDVLELIRAIEYMSQGEDGKLDSDFAGLRENHSYERLLEAFEEIINSDIAKG
ncbi:MAG: glycosyltransferase family 4 protein [Oscillatoria sp. SIO1A7]|nr:glycosyltransferase family 4 protein [Oscillatoria sp. SIO1A7]